MQGTGQEPTLFLNTNLSSLALLNAIPQQIWTANTTGKIDYVNETLSRDFGYPAKEVIELGWAFFVHPDDLPLSLKRWQESLHSEKEYSSELRLRFGDGAYHWHLVRAVLMRVEDKPGVWVGTCMNIQASKENEFRKDEFISTASHELKTPLTSIKGYNQIMIRIADNRKVKDFLHRTEAQLVRLEKLISDLLDVSKINVGKLPLNMEDFEFSELLQETVGAMQIIYPSHRIILNDRPQVNIHGDRYRLEQVIQNFISNAVKYSPNADHILIDTEIQDDNLVVAITDYGIGIDSEEITKLFERYYRSDNSSAKFDGLGLGLYISAEIIKRHGGSFWIESELNKGSVFSFKLPLVPLGEIIPENQTVNYYKDRYIEIYCPPDSAIMYVRWWGHQDMHSVKHGGRMMVDYLRSNGRSKVFNDNREVIGTWSEASDWAAEVWLPLMEDAGLQFFAWVFSASVFSQLSAQKSVDNKDKKSEIAFFYQAEDAIDWLNSFTDM